MPKNKSTTLLAVLSLVSQLANGQLEPDCNPLQADCPAKKAWPHDNYFIDFTKQKGPPDNWIIANYEHVEFTSKGAEFTYAKRGDAPNMWTDFYMLGGRYDVQMQIAPGQGIVSSAVLWSDIQDEIDWEFSGNQFGEKPFPPTDGKFTVETNIFARGKMWDGAATYQKDALRPTTQFHTYSVEWDENHMTWYVDNNIVRTVKAQSTPSGFVFPQSPMKLQLGVWGGGDPDNNYWTIQWAGGQIDLTGVPYTMYVKSVNITNKYPACQYKFKDRTGLIGSVDKIQSGCSPSSSSAAASPTSVQNLVKNHPGVETYPAVPLSSASSNPPTVATTSSSGSAPPTLSSSAPSGSGAGYPVASQSTSVSTSSLSTSLGGYPVASQSSPTSSTTASRPVSSSRSASSSSFQLPSSVSSVSSVPPINRYYSVSSLGSSTLTSTSSSMTTSTSPAGYPVVNQSKPTSSSSSLAGSSRSLSSSALLSSNLGLQSTSGKVTMATTSASAYPVASSSSGSGILSSLSSLLLGSSTSAMVSSSAALNSTLTTSSASIVRGMTSSEINNASSNIYPTTSLSSNQAPGISSGAMSSSSSIHSSRVSDSSIVGSVPGSTMSTVYSTNIYTVTSCAQTVTNCPVGQVTTELISLTTTLCPVTEIDNITPGGTSFVANSTVPMSTKASSSFSSLVSASNSTLPTSVPTTESSETMPTTYTFSSEIVTTGLSTVYSTNVVTITSCAPTVTNCPVGKVTTEVISLYTTICPITQTVLDDKTYGGQVKQIPSSTPVAVSTGTLSSSVSSSTHRSSKSTLATSIPSGGTSLPVPTSSIVYPNSTIATSGELSSVSRMPSKSSSQVAATPTQFTTSTVYSTNVYTITSCASTVTNCPASLGQVTTELISLYTTVCPVEQLAETPTETSTQVISASSSVAPSASMPESVVTSTSNAPEHTTSPSNTPERATSQSVASVAPVYTTSTVYTTSEYTISSCAPGAVECSSSIGSVTTETIALYTTVCPVEEASISSSVSITSTVSDAIVKPVSSLVSKVSSSMLEFTSHTSTFSSLTSAPPAPLYTTSTVYTTTEYTITSCAPTVSNCPAKLGSVTTETIAAYTTVCPVEDQATPQSSTPEMDVPSYQMSEQSSTLEMITSSIPTRTTAKSIAATEAETQPTPDEVTTITSSVTNVRTVYQPPTSVSQVPQQQLDQCVCEPTTVYATATVTVAETTITSIKTIQPPFPQSGTGYGTGYGTGSLTRATSVPSSSGTEAMSMSTGAAMRRWLRRGVPRHGHGHGHQ